MRLTIKRSFSVKILISICLSLGLISAVAIAKPADRKLAQKVECVPLGVPFNVFSENTDSVDYTLEEFRMLRNSIYAQVGFKFKSAAVINEMTKRGCLRADAKYTPESLQPVDKKNASLIKSWERSLKESADMEDFAGAWAKAAKSVSERTKLLGGHYCYISDAKDKYFGILYFGMSKAAGGSDLNGMMNLEKPSWADPMSDEERAAYKSNIKYKELDTTSATILDYATKGTWAIKEPKAGQTQLQISISSDHKKVANGAVEVTAENYKNGHILDCKLTQ